MKLSLRKSWWWLTPLAIALILVGIYASLAFRRNKQAKIANEIVSLGGWVGVRSQSPAWLFHFASDNCRNRFRESVDVSPWLSDWLRNSFFGDGVGAFIKSFDVADQVYIRVDNEASSVSPDDEYVEILPQDLPAILAAVSRLATVRDLEIDCWTTCELGFHDLPSSLESLRIRGSSDVSRASFRVNPTPHNLKRLECSGASLAEGPSGFDTESVVQISKCSALRALCLEGTSVGDSEIAHLRKLDQLESLSIDGRKLSDSGLDQLKAFSKLAEGAIPVEASTEPKVDELRLRFAGVRFYRIPRPKPGDFETISSRIGGGGALRPRLNGFDRPELFFPDGGMGMF